MKEPLLLSVQNKLIFEYNPGRMQIDAQFTIKNVTSDLIEIKIELSNFENYVVNPKQFYLRSFQLVLVNIKQKNYMSIPINERAKIMYRIINSTNSAQHQNYQINYNLYRYLFFQMIENENVIHEPDIATQIIQRQNNNQQMNQNFSNDIQYEIHFFTIIICTIIAIFALLYQLYTKIVQKDI